MPSPGKKKFCRMTDEQLLHVLLSGRYRIDIEAGEIYSNRYKTQRDTPLCKYYSRTDPEKRHPFICVFYTFDSSQGIARRGVSLAKAIWMYSRQSAVPPDFEIHHVDLNPLNDNWRNLVALHKLDHNQLHLLLNADSVVEEEVPF